MSKAKTAGDKATASAETVLENGAAAMKTGLEKALKSYDAFVGYGKDTADQIQNGASSHPSNVAKSGTGWACPRIRCARR